MNGLVFLAYLAMAASQDILPATSAPAGAVLAARPIRPGDLLSVMVYGSPELTGNVRVNASGLITLPMLPGAVEALGVTPEELGARIAGAITQAKVLVRPSVHISISEYGSRPVSVAGAVRHPLTFQVPDRVTLLEALTRAEGLSADAGPEILVTRGGAPQRIPVGRLMGGEDPSLNLVLEGGEEVRVPIAGQIFVVGNVRKPGAFRLEGGAAITVMKALAMAEGLSPFSSKEAYIYRRAKDGSGPANEIELPLAKLLSRNSADVSLEAGDILYIPDSRRRRTASAAIERALSFAVGTASGALILGVNR